MPRCGKGRRKGWTRCAKCGKWLFPTYNRALTLMKICWICWRTSVPLPANTTIESMRRMGESAEAYEADVWEQKREKWLKRNR